MYEGSERDCTCDHLLPGHLYRLRVSCVSSGGQSEVGFYAIPLEQYNQSLLLVIHYIVCNVVSTL